MEIKRTLKGVLPVVDTDSESYIHPGLPIRYPQRGPNSVEIGRIQSEPRRLFDEDYSNDLSDFKLTQATVNIVVNSQGKTRAITEYVKQDGKKGIAITRGKDEDEIVRKLKTSGFVESK